MDCIFEFSLVYNNNDNNNNNNNNNNIIIIIIIIIIIKFRYSTHTGRKNGFASNLLSANMMQTCANWEINLSKAGKCKFAYLFTLR